MDEIGNPEEEKKVSKKLLSLERLRLATERSQLASIRAALTLIALGFAAYKVFYARMEAGEAPVLQFGNGRDIGILTISIGLILMVLSTLQHHKSRVKLKEMYPEAQYSVSTVLSYLILLLSAVLLTTVLFRL